VVPPAAFDAPSSAVDHSSPYSDPNVAVIEFDQHGNLWPCDATSAKCQEEYAVDFIHKARGSVPPGEKLIVLTFIHGWLHNADWNDQNFLHLRQAVDCLNWGEKGFQAGYKGNLNGPQTEDVYDLQCKGIVAQAKTHYVGVYIGWQGTPANHSRSNGTLLTVYKRADETSHNPAMQGVIEKLATASKDGTGQSAEFIVAGHSMGGFLTERMAQAELSSFPPATRDICSNGRSGRVSPVDLFVLINPANTASVGLDIIHGLRKRPICTTEELTDKVTFPYLVSVHSLTDPWTGKIGAVGLHALNALHATLNVGTPFEPIDPSTAPTEQDNEGRSYVSPAVWRMNGRPFHQTQFLMTMCFEGSWSIRTDGTDSRTSDGICDRVSEQAKEIKVGVIQANHLPNILQDNGVDMGTYEYLQSICDSAADPAAGNSCTGDRKALRDRSQSLLSSALSGMMVFPQFSGEPNSLLDLYIRFDLGCRDGASDDPQASKRPKCQGKDDPASLPPPSLIPQAPWNNTGYWAIDVPDSYISGHSAFWTDNFTSLLLGLVNAAK
jgi:pimeloyl-ACP methyl ester carboxylesterase